MNNTHKYWTRFAVSALVNAAVFVAYRVAVYKAQKNDEAIKQKPLKTKEGLDIHLMEKDTAPKKTSAVKKAPRKRATKTVKKD